MFSESQICCSHLLPLLVHPLRKNILEMRDNGRITTAVLIKTHLTDKGDQVDGLVVVAGTPPVQMLNQTLSAMQVLVTEKDGRATVEVLHTDMLKTISTSSHRKRVTHGHRSRLFTTIRSIFHQNCSAGMPNRMAVKKSETTARQILLNFTSAKVAIWWRRKLRSGGG